MEPIRNNTQISTSEQALKFNPYDPLFQNNPYPTYHKLRSIEPIHQSFTGMWVPGQTHLIY